MPCLIQKIDTVTGEHLTIDLLELARAVQQTNPALKILEEGKEISPDIALQKCTVKATQMKAKGLLNSKP